MLTKEELLIWKDAHQAFQQGQLDLSLDLFESMGDFSKVSFNMAMIHLQLQHYEQAVNLFSKALLADPYLAVAYFQRGYCQFLLEDYMCAEEDYSIALELLLENDCIEYAQLDLCYTLYRCETQYNRAMCRQLLGRHEDSLLDISLAQKCTLTPHQKEIVGVAARTGVAELTLFAVPCEVLFTVSESKIKNIGKKQHLPSAKVVLSANGDTQTEFSGAAMLNTKEDKSDDEWDTTLRRGQKQKLEEIRPRYPSLQKINTSLISSLNSALSPLSASPLTRSATLSSTRSATRQKLGLYIPSGATTSAGPRSAYPDLDAISAHSGSGKILARKSSLASVSSSSTSRYPITPPLSPSLTMGRYEQSMSPSPLSASSFYQRSPTWTQNKILLRSPTEVYSPRPPAPHRSHTTNSSVADKIRFKVHFKNTNAVAIYIPKDCLGLGYLQGRIKEKLRLPFTPTLGYRDEEDSVSSKTPSFQPSSDISNLIVMADNDDVEMAIELGGGNLWIIPNTPRVSPRSSSIQNKPFLPMPNLSGPSLDFNSPFAALGGDCYEIFEAYG